MRARTMPVIPVDEHLTPAELRLAYVGELDYLSSSSQQRILSPEDDLSPPARTICHGGGCGGGGSGGGGGRPNKRFFNFGGLTRVFIW